MLNGHKLQIHHFEIPRIERALALYGLQAHTSHDEDLSRIFPQFLSVESKGKFGGTAVGYLAIPTLTYQSFANGLYGRRIADTFPWQDQRRSEST